MALSQLLKGILLLISFLITTFGQPAWNEWVALCSAFCGYALFWRVMLSIPMAKARFLLAFGWYGAVQWIQLSWFQSHPYFYIYGVIAFCAFVMALQWGFLAIWIEPKAIRRIPILFALAGLWTLLEWSRLFILSGLPFNPVGLSLSASLYSLQFASLFGIYGLSFWVILTNLLLLRAWIESPSWRRWAALGTVMTIPFIFGWLQLERHQQKFSSANTVSVLLVQPALPIEENLRFQSADEARQFVLDEWRQVLSTMREHIGKKIDLIVLPEYIVPYGTFHHVFPLGTVRDLFSEIFGNQTRTHLTKNSPYVDFFDTDRGVIPLVSNAYLAQSLADIFHAHVVIGLEDSLYTKEGKKSESYSSAFHFIPESNMPPRRYEKRVLVPMGEYIPFHWCRQIAACYGITGSFTCGTEAKVFPGPVPFGISICYEEIYGNMMRENRAKGAELLVNCTNDGWFPNSRLPKQHFDHARLRTVENGIPLIRACNTGITGAIDSLGRIVGLLGEDHLQMQETSGSVRLDVPLYHYRTLYAQLGNLPILGFSLLCLIWALFLKNRPNFNSWR